MKKLYFLDEQEKQRILNLHTEATKKHYINSGKLLTEGITPMTLLNLSRKVTGKNISKTFTKGFGPFSKQLGKEIVDLRSNLPKINPIAIKALDDTLASFGDKLDEFVTVNSDGIFTFKGQSGLEFTVDDFVKLIERNLPEGADVIPTPKQLEELAEVMPKIKKINGDELLDLGPTFLDKSKKLRSDKTFVSGHYSFTARNTAKLADKPKGLINKIIGTTGKNSVGGGTGGGTGTGILGFYSGWRVPGKTGLKALTGKGALLGTAHLGALYGLATMAFSGNLKKDAETMRDNLDRVCKSFKDIKPEELKKIDSTDHAAAREIYDNLTDALLYRHLNYFSGTDVSKIRENINKISSRNENQLCLVIKEFYNDSAASDSIEPSQQNDIPAFSHKFMSELYDDFIGLLDPAEDFTQYVLKPLKKIVTGILSVEWVPPAEEKEKEEEKKDESGANTPPPQPQPTADFWSKIDSRLGCLKQYTKDNNGRTKDIPNEDIFRIEFNNEVFFPAFVREDDGVLKGGFYPDSIDKLREVNNYKPVLDVTLFSNFYCEGSTLKKDSTKIFK